MKLNHRDIWRCDYKQIKGMTCRAGKGGTGVVGWWQLTFRIIKGSEVEWLAQEKIHGSHSVGCKSSPKGNTRYNMPHNLMFRNFMPQIHTNNTLCKTHALGSTEWCDVCQISFQKRGTHGKYKMTTASLFSFYIYLSGDEGSACHSVSVEVWGQLTAVSSLLSPHSSQGLNPGLQVWQQASLLSEPHQWAFYDLLKLTVSSCDAPHRDTSIHKEL